MQFLNTLALASVVVGIPLSPLDQALAVVNAAQSTSRGTKTSGLDWRFCHKYANGATSKITEGKLSDTRDCKQLFDYFRTNNYDYYWFNTTMGVNKDGEAKDYFTLKSAGTCSLAVRLYNKQFGENGNEAGIPQGKEARISFSDAARVLATALNTSRIAPWGEDDLAPTVKAAGMDNCETSQLVKFSYMWLIYRQ